MRLFRLTAQGPQCEYIKYVVAPTISQAIRDGSGFPGAVEVVKVEELASDVVVIE